MILTLSIAEISVVLLHMTISRKTIRNGLKKQLNKNNKEDGLNSYDEIKNGLETIINDIDEHDANQDDMHQLNFNVREINMLHLFLNWYVSRLDKLLNEAESRTHKTRLNEDEKQLKSMINIKDKIEKLKQVHNIA